MRELVLPTKASKENRLSAESTAANIQAHHRALRVTAVESPVRKHRHSPTPAAEHLRPRQRFEEVRPRLCDDQFAAIAQDNQFAVRSHDRAEPKAFVFPLHLAG